jgi:hypothetical protein
MPSASTRHCGVVAVAPEHLHRLLDDGVLIELPRPSQGCDLSSVVYLWVKKRLEGRSRGQRRSSGVSQSLPSTWWSRNAVTVWYQRAAFCGVRIQWFSSG